MRATEHAPRNPFQFLECSNSLAHIVERGAGDTSATLDDFREAVATMEGIERTARRVLGGTHPLTESIEAVLQNARAALRARETPPRSA